MFHVRSIHLPAPYAQEEIHLPPDCRHRFRRTSPGHPIRREPAWEFPAAHTRAMFAARIEQPLRAAVEIFSDVWRNRNPAASAVERSARPTIDRRRKDVLFRSRSFAADVPASVLRPLAHHRSLLVRSPLSLLFSGCFNHDLRLHLVAPNDFRRRRHLCRNVRLSP